MAEIYILSQHDNLLASLSEETGLISTLFKEELNRLADEPFSFTVDATVDNAQHVREENQVVFTDKEGELRLYVIKELDETGTGDSAETVAICEPAFMELKENVIVDRRFVNTTAQPALNAALQNTRWTGNIETELGTATTNFYYLTSVDAIWRILEVWGGEFKDVVEFDGNRITARKISILQRRGADNGKRFDIEHNIDEIQRTIVSYPVTAIYGRGASLPIEDDEGNETGGFTRYIGFGDVAWSKANGDPVDKPRGQLWIGDPEALQKYGREHNGQLLHRQAEWQNGDYEDPAELLKATWDQLQKVNKAEVNYRLSAFLLESIAGYEHEKVSLGDTGRVINRDFARPIEIQARVIAIEYDLMDIDGTATVEMGQFLSAHEYDDRLDRVVRDINDNRGRWEQGAKPISPDSYPDIVPSVPSHLEAVGAFKTVQLHWSFNLNEVYVRAYELYASQVAGFVPSPETMVYRGTLNGFVFNGNTDTTYYFRVRAVNYHGRYSAFSGQVSATTARVLTDDILFGPDLAEKLRELNKEADIIGTDGIDLDKISKEVFDQIEKDRKRYTSQEIAHVENALTQELADRAKVEDVQREFNRINDSVAEGKETLEKVSKDLLEMDEHFKAEFKFLEDGLSGKISSGEVNRLLGDKVDVSVYQQQKADLDFSIDGLKTSFETANTKIDNATNEIVAVERRTASIEASNKGFLVDINELKNQEIGGQNIARTTEKDFTPSGWQGSTNTITRDVTVSEWSTDEAVRVSSTGGTALLKNHITVLNNNLKMAGAYYTLSVWIKNNHSSNICRLSNNNSGSVQIFPGESKRVFMTFIANANSHIQLSLNALSVSENIDVTLWRVQLEEGNRMTGYQKPIKDLVDLLTYSARQTSLDTTIQGITGRVGATESGLTGVRNTQAQFQLDLNGFTTSVRDLQTGLNGKVDNKTYTDRQTSLDSTIEGITGRVSTTENGISGLSSRVGTLELTDSQFSTRISSIEKRYNELEIGGTNLIVVKDLTYGRYVQDSGNEHVDTNWVFTDFIPVIGNQEYIASNYSNLGTAPATVFYDYSKNYISGIRNNNSGGVPANDRRRIVKTPLNSRFMKFSFERKDIGKIKLERGNKASDFSPSPLDMVDFQTYTDNIQRIEKAETAIQQNATAITQRATTTSVDSLTGRMSTAEGSIRTQAREIDLRVKSDGIVSAINVTPESIRIDGALIRITGRTLIDNAVIKAAMIEEGAVGTLAIANASISRGKLQEAIITNAYIAEATIQNSKIANLSADKINAGILRSIDIIGVTITGSTIRSTNGNNNTEITGGSLTSTGRYTRTWRGSTETNTVTLRAFNGYFRAENPSRDRAVSFSDFGISTFADGNGGGSSSGTIEFFSRRYSNVNGLTVYSSGTFGVDADEIVSQSRFAHLIESNESQIYMRPNRTNRPGNNTFMVSVINESSESNTDGIIAYGSSANGYASGLRFSKAASNPTIYALDGNLNRWGSSRFEAGYFAGHMVMSHTGSNFYVGSSNEIRMVNSTAYINGNINYIDAKARIFHEMSSRETKMDIVPFRGSGLETLRELTVTNFYFKTDVDRENLRIGLIAEDSPSVASPDAKAIATSKVTYYSLKAIQELDTKVEYIEDELSVLRIENKLMKQRIAKLEGKIA